MSVVAVVAVVTVVTVVAIAAVAIVLGWVIVRRVSWCGWSGRPIQANDTAACNCVDIVSCHHNGSADDAVFASKVLQKCWHFVFIFRCRKISSMVIQCASLFRRCHMGILQWVVHITHLVTNTVASRDVSVLVDCERQSVTARNSCTTIVVDSTHDLNRVAWKLAESQRDLVILGIIGNVAGGVDGGGELGGNVGDLRS